MSLIDPSEYSHIILPNEIKVIAADIKPARKLSTVSP